MDALSWKLPIANKQTSLSLISCRLQRAVQSFNPLKFQKSSLTEAVCKKIPFRARLSQLWNVIIADTLLARIWLPHIKHLALSQHLTGPSGNNPITAVVNIMKDTPASKSIRRTGRRIVYRNIKPTAQMSNNFQLKCIYYTNTLKAKNSRKTLHLSAHSSSRALKNYDCDTKTALQ